MEPKSDGLDIDEIENEFPSADDEEDCPVCGGTGWIQEGWGDYHMDGIPCLACEQDDQEA